MLGLGGRATLDTRRGRRGCSEEDEGCLRFVFALPVPEGAIGPRRSHVEASEFDNGNCWRLIAGNYSSSTVIYGFLGFFIFDLLFRLFALPPSPSPLPHMLCLLGLTNKSKELLQ